jgi:hypothetical protein
MTVIFPSKFVLRVCEQVHSDGLCPALCLKHGGCLIQPQRFVAGRWVTHPSEAKRRFHRAHRILAEANNLRHKCYRKEVNHVSQRPNPQANPEQPDSRSLPAMQVVRGHSRVS